MTDVYGPWVFDGQEFVEGGVSVENGKIVGVSDSPPEDITHRCILFPMLVNAHTHIGDAFIKKVPKGTIEDIVAPPSGFKFRMLAKTPSHVIAEGMAKAAAGMGKAGIEAFIDFRENGLPGVQTLRGAVRNQRIEAVIMGRPRNLDYDADEVEAILKDADGIGISSKSEWRLSDLDRMAAQTRKARKLFAIHTSERVREPFDRIARLKPDFVVHMLKTDGKDLHICSRDGIPVVVCPRSNAFFGLMPPVRRMLDAGIEVALGTDNAMLAKPDMLAEARFLARTQPGLTAQEIVRMAISAPRKVLNREPGLRLKKGNLANFAVLAVGRGDPAKAFLAPGKSPLVVHGANRR